MSFKEESASEKISARSLNSSGKR